MSNFILCLECKEYLGKYKSFIIAYTLDMKRLNDKIIKDSHPTKLETNKQNQIDPIKDLLDSLGIKKLCCRTHLISGFDFWECLFNSNEI